MDEEFLIESNDTFSLIREAEGKEWDVILIEVGLSKNGNFYSAACLKNAAPLFEGLKACAYRFGDQFNHLPNDQVSRSKGFAQNVVGWFENVRFGSFTRKNGTQAEGLIARFHIMPGAKWLMENMKDAFEHGMGHLLGFSIDCEGQTRIGMLNGQRVRFIEKLTRAVSTDVVSHPAAGGGLMRLVASRTESSVDDILKLITENFPDWKKGFVKEDDESTSAFLLRIFEGNLRDTRKLFEETDSEDSGLVEVAKSIKTFTTLIEMIKEEKFTEALHLMKKTNKSSKDKDSPFKETALGNFLKSESEKKGIQQEQLASAAGISASTVNQIMSGEITRPPDSRLKEFARVLQVSFETLLNLIPSTQRETVDGAFITNNEHTENETMTEDEKKALEEKRLAEERDKKLNIRETAIKVKEKVGETDLPKKAQERVIKFFEGKEEVTDEDITKAVESERDYIKELTKESGKPEGLGDAHEQGDDTTVTITKEDREKLDLALDGMWAGRDQGGVRKFGGLYEAFETLAKPKIYMSRAQAAKCIMECICLSLPRNLSENQMGQEVFEDHRHLISESWGGNNSGFGPSSFLREAVDTGTFPVTFGDSMFRRLAKMFDESELNDWRVPVSSIENLGDATNTFHVTSLGGAPNLPIVAQRGAYQDLVPNPTEKDETITPDKYGGILSLTWEDVLADKMGYIRRIPKVLADAATGALHKVVWDLIDTNQSVQGNVLIDNANNNRVATDPALSYSAVASAIALMRKQTLIDTSRRAGIAPKFLLTGPDLELKNEELTTSTTKATTAEDSTIANIIKNKFKMQSHASIGLGITGANRWYIMADPTKVETLAVGFLGGNDRPEIFVQDSSTPTQGSFFSADVVTFKERFVFGATLVDFRGFAGALTA